MERYKPGSSTGRLAFCCISPVLVSALSYLLMLLQKVCITVPGVRPLADEELEKRFRAVEHVRSGTSKPMLCFCLSHCFSEHSLRLR